ncbi:EVI2A protein, partial [Nothoprocta ornata]|nr:EVI2A protein [Nothoprocta pentlandii]NWY04476.1 EVI2A protein [Nothoprocta ornata]
MKTERRSEGHFAFFAAVIFSLYLHISANHSGQAMVTSDTWNSTSPHPGRSLTTSEGSREMPLSAGPSHKAATVLGKWPGTSQPWSSTGAPSSPTPSPATSAASAAGGARDTTQAKTTATRDACEDHKPLVLICFIVIAVLVLICTFLLLSTVVLANKLSCLKKARQGRRAPRSNGDFLAASSLWPTAAGSWLGTRTEAAGADTLAQELLSEREAVLQSRAADAATQHPATEGAAHRPSRDTKTLESLVTHFAVEI